MRRVVVTAGHNGPGTGANGYLDEGKETIELRDIVYSKLKMLGVDVHKDKDTDRLSTVVSWVKSIVGKQDIVCDIHFNAATPQATGVEVLVSKEGELERKMAGEICDKLSSVMGIRNRGIKTESQSARGKLAMLSSFNCEQILIEVCFVSNAEDARRYKANKYNVANAIVDVLSKYSRV